MGAHSSQAVCRAEVGHSSSANKSDVVFQGRSQEHVNDSSILGRADGRPPDPPIQVRLSVRRMYVRREDVAPFLFVPSLLLSDTHPPHPDPSTNTNKKGNVSRYHQKRPPFATKPQGQPQPTTKKESSHHHQMEARATTSTTMEAMGNTTTTQGDHHFQHMMHGPSTPPKVWVVLIFPFFFGVVLATHNVRQKTWRD